MTRPIEAVGADETIKLGIMKLNLGLIGLPYDKFEERNLIASMIGCLSVSATLQGVLRPRRGHGVPSCTGFGAFQLSANYKRIAIAERDFGLVRVAGSSPAGCKASLVADRQANLASLQINSRFLV